jgi:hypothetical protein
MEKATIAKDKNGQLYLKNFYTPLSVAKKDIWRRWNDKELRKRVEKYLGADVPKTLKNKPRAILARPITSPNFEFFYFSKLAKSIGLTPLYIECTGEKFVSNNIVKYHLCRLFFYDGKGTNGGNRLSAFPLVDFNKYGGKRFNKIKTTSGSSLVKFHHDNISNGFSAFKKNIFDISPWLDKYKKVNGKHFYFNYLLLFVMHGVLFENYMLSDPEEREYTNEIVLPAFKKIERLFKIKPLIVPALPLDKENDLRWYCYPKYIHTF